jgi:hypothetical protein
MTTAQFAALSPTQLKNVTASQVSSVSNDVKAWLYSKGYTTISSDLQASSAASSGIDTTTTVTGLTGASSVSAVYTAGRKAVSITAGTAADTIIGSPLNDTIAGGNGADDIQAGAGKDGITFAARANLITATVDGGTGIDTITMTAHTGITTGDFANVSGVEKLTLGGAGGTVTFADDFDSSGIASIVGSSGADLVTFSGIPNVSIDSGTGADTYTVTGANGGTLKFTTALAGVVITGGAGAESITLASSVSNGTTTIAGGADNDTINLGSGHTGGVSVTLDSITTEANADTISNFIATIDKVVLVTGTTAATGATVATLNATPGTPATDIAFDTAANLGSKGSSLNAAAAVNYAVASDTGSIFYDADGDWTSGSVQIGTIGVVTGLTAANFLLA